MIISKNSNSSSRYDTCLHKTTGVHEMKYRVCDPVYPSHEFEDDNNLEEFLEFILKSCPTDSGKADFDQDRFHKKISIDKVTFNPPATVVFWSDGSKTVVKDEDMKNAIDPSVKFNSDELVYGVKASKDEKVVEKRVNYTRWKEDGLLNAIMKKMVPNYIDILDKYCQ